MSETKLNNLNDEQLISKYLSGDQSAFEFLIQRYLNQIYNFVFKYVHTAAEAEDVTQEAFLKIWKNLKRFDLQRKFKTWAFTIAKNTALDHLKKKGLVAFSELSFEDGAENSFEASLVSSAPLPENAFEKIEQIAMVGHAVAKLTPTQKEVLDLYYKKGLNFREISEFLKQSINTVKTRHRRALIFLKKHLENSPDNE